MTPPHHRPHHHLRHQSRHHQVRLVFVKIIVMLESDHGKFVLNQKDQWSFESDRGKLVLDQKDKWICTKIHIFPTFFDVFRKVLSSC